MAQRVNGRVKWFDPHKGYGFIELDGREDAFVHHTEIKMRGYRILRDGEDVTLEVHNGPKGLLAVAVEVAGGGRR